MSKILAYLKVSIGKQDVDSQKLMILEFAQRSKLTIDGFIEYDDSIRKNMHTRPGKEMLSILSAGDTLIVTDLTRIGRSLVEIIEVLIALAHKRVDLHVISGGMNAIGTGNIADICQNAVFGRLAKPERDMISDMLMDWSTVSRNGRPRREASFGKIITIFNCKGGVGKTTLTANLAHSLSNRRKSVLVVDLDSQCNVTNLLLPRGARLNLYDLLESTGKPVEMLIYPTEYERIRIIPNVEETSSLEMGLLALGLRQAFNILRNRLRQYAIERFDYILLDSPPNLGFFVMSALYCSDFAIVPVPSTNSFGIEGLSRASLLVDRIRARDNHSLESLRFLVNSVDNRTSVGRRCISMLVEKFGKERLFESTIPYSSAFQQAEQLQQTVIRFAPNSPGAKAYRKLTGELETILNPERAKALN